MALRIRLALLLSLVCPAAILAQPAPSPQGAPTQPAVEYEIHGVVLSGATPLPGVSIIAANSLTGKKVVTSTDVTGGYRLVLPGKGRWVLRAEFSAFATQTAEVRLDPAAPSKVNDFNLVLLSRVPKPEQQTGDESAQLPSGPGAAQQGRSSQRLSVTADQNGLSSSAGETPLPGMPSLAGSADSDNASLAVNGQGGQTRDFGLMNMDDLRERIEEMRARGQLPEGGMTLGGGGGFGGPGGSGPGVFIMSGQGGDGRAGGGFRNFNINQPHGAIYYTAGNGALDASPYSLSGAENGRPGYDSNRFGGMVGGPLRIPHVYDDGGKTMFFVNYAGTRSMNPYDVFSHVPTAGTTTSPLEREGSFCNTTYTSGPNKGQPVQLYNPATGLPMGCDISGMIDPTALKLLAYIPRPNQAGSLQNFHFASAVESNSDNLSVRLIHNFGAPMLQQGRGRGTGGHRSRNNINFALNYSDGASDQLTPFPSFFGTAHSNGMNATAGWSLSKNKWSSNLRVGWNRNRASTANNITGLDNVAALLGIPGTGAANPNDCCVPNIAFSDYSGINEVRPQSRDDEAFSLGETVVWSHGKHNLRFGADYRRLWTSAYSSLDPRGTFTFTGYATAAKDVQGHAIAGTGYDFADFLLGYAQQTSIQYSPSTEHFRANSYDVFVQDDWRVRSNLTINAGLRYEYVSPYTEADNRLVNLSVTPGFTSATHICAGATVCTLNGITVQGRGDLPASLVRSDRNNFAPRVGIAWKPKGDKTVIRAGYGINYNLGQYRSIVNNLAQQPPFSVTQTDASTAAALLGFANTGFNPILSATTVTNNYGIDPDFRLGYVQVWNLNVQRELTQSLLLNVMYTGSKGTALDMVRAPNRTPTGLLDNGAQPYLWETSQGSSILHAGSVRVRKRMTRGFSVGGTYTLSKSIDNASSIGGGAVTVAQNDQNLAAERGLSSFDQRHKFTGDWLYELPLGSGKRWLNSRGPAQRFFGDWTLSGDFTIASGLPFTAHVLGDFVSVAGGANGSLRADYNGQPIEISDRTLPHWFNTAAFTVPAAGTFGSAGRNTIIGPGTVLFNLAVHKSFPMKDMMGMEVSASLTNVFNHPNYSSVDTTVNSPTFGQVIGVASMRKVTMSMRYRF